MSDKILGNIEKEISFLETGIQDCLNHMYKEDEKYQIDIYFDRAILQLVSYHARCRERRARLDGKIMLASLYGKAALEAGKEENEE